MDTAAWRQQFSDPTIIHPVVFPVIHVANVEQACSNIRLIEDKPIGGVFLINHEFDHEQFIPIIKEVRNRFPSLWLGVNFLAQPGDVAFPILASLQDDRCRVDGYWADDACVDERTPFYQQKAKRISEIRKLSGWKGLYLGGVAFKKQREVPAGQYGLSAKIAASFMDVVCTSGTKTGSAPHLEKMKAFKEGCGRDKPLAVASGITEDNVKHFIPYVNCILVATGISKDFHTLDPDLLQRLLHVIKEAASYVRLVRPTAWYLSLIAVNTKGPEKAWLDPSSIYADDEAFQDLITDMLSPFPPDSYDMVAGIDGMGFPTGGAIAQRHRKGLVVIRKKDKLCVDTIDVEFVNYRKSAQALEVRACKPFASGSRVLLVDQWVETGGTMLAAIELINRSGGVVAGVTTVCIERNTDLTRQLKDQHKCHEVVPERVHHLFDSHEYRADKHSHFLLE